MLFLFETVVFIAVCIGSLYASIVDFRDRIYAPLVELALLLTGISSFIGHLMFLNFSCVIINRGIISVGLALIFSLIWHKLKIVGDGDGKYLVSVALCYPSYPSFFASQLAVVGFIPIVYTSTPFSILILLNAAITLGFFIMFLEFVHSKRLRFLYIVYALPITLIALFYTLNVLLALPIPALISAIMNSGKARFNVPFIPCLFTGFICSLIFGDLLLWIFR